MTTAGATTASRTQLTSWRVAAQVRADRLLDEIAALPGIAPATAQTAPAQTAAAQAAKAVQRAQKILEESLQKTYIRRFWDGVTGSQVEQVWQLLHLAEEEMVFAQDDAILMAQKPYYRELAAKAGTRDRTIKAEGAVKLWNTPLTLADRQLAHDLLMETHGMSDADHQKVRGFRNLLYALAAIVAVLVVVIWQVGLAETPIVWLGALGGAVSVVFAFSKSGPSTPYNLATPQMLLKIVAGAATAVLAVKIVDASLPGLSDQAAEMYAVVFGFSQQAFTQLADKRVAALKEALDPET